MMTKIAYVDETWNPIAGCTKVSVGCETCYAEKMSYRLACMGQKKYQRVIGQFNSWNDVIFCDEKALDIPLHWKKPRRIFVNSMSDTFHEKVSFEFIDKIFAVMALCPQHTFQCLSKRPEIMLEYINWQSNEPDIVGRYNRGQKIDGSGHRGKYICGFTNCKWPLSNIHLGTTVENQDNDWRISKLLQCPAAVRFISAEPLLGDIKFNFATPCDRDCNEYQNAECPGTSGFCIMQYQIDQVIIGAESIGGAAGRECKISWIRNIVKQCKAAGVACFVKQIHMWRTKVPESLLINAPLVDAYFETEAEAEEWEGTKPKRVLLKYPRDKDLFPKDLCAWEYPK